MPDGVVSYGDRTRRPCRSQSPANLPHAVNSRERAELLRQQTEQADRNTGCGPPGSLASSTSQGLWAPSKRRDSNPLENLLTTAAPKPLAGDSISRGNLQQRRVLMGYQWVILPRRLVDQDGFASVASASISTARSSCSVAIAGKGQRFRTAAPTALPSGERFRCGSFGGALEAHANSNVDRHVKLDQALLQERSGQVVPEFNPSVAIARTAAELLKEDIAFAPQRRIGRPKVD